MTSSIVDTIHVALCPQRSTTPLHAAALVFVRLLLSNRAARAKPMFHGEGAPVEIYRAHDNDDRARCVCDVCLHCAHCAVENENRDATHEWEMCLRDVGVCLLQFNRDCWTRAVGDNLCQPFRGHAEGSEIDYERDWLAENRHPMCASWWC